MNLVTFNIFTSFNILMVPQIFSNYTSPKNSIRFSVIDDVQQDSKTACGDNAVMPIIKLLHFIALNYLTQCDSVILYDEFFSKSLSFQPVIMELLKSFPIPMTHGQFRAEDLQVKRHFNSGDARCQNFIVLTQMLEVVTYLLGYQPQNKVILVPQASQWQITNFIESRSSSMFTNLLVIADPLLQGNDFYEKDKLKVDINLYTHELYADARGASSVRLVTAWRCDHLTRPSEHLFPPKILSMKGYQLRVCATQQPPYVYQTYELDKRGDAQSHWDGLEVRLLKLISNELNFTIRFLQPTKVSSENTAESVLAELTEANRVDVAIAGVYVTADRQQLYKLSSVHSHDCAVFMTQSSTALPKYRAIMGPFRWEVWMCITLAYTFAILPISFSVHHTLRLLLDKPYEIENMFWYVFGTFTNCFTFSGKKSWNSGKMASTRMFIGTYWAFSIIVSAAYSGSIIAFIMLPVFPQVMDTPRQLVDEHFKLIVTNSSDLKQSLYNSKDEDIEKLSKNIKIVNTIEEAISNVSKARFFTHYSFLHSREFLKHVLRSNLTKIRSSHKKDVFHLSNNCFLPMLVSMVFPKESILSNRFNRVLSRAVETGFIDKLVNDVAWDQQKSNTGKLLQVSAGSRRTSRVTEDRQLTLDDTQGMFLLMGAGFALAGLAMLVECSVYLVHSPTYYCSLQHLLSKVYPKHHSSQQQSAQSQISSDGFDRYFGSRTEHNLFTLDDLIPMESTTNFKCTKSQSVIDLNIQHCHNKDQRLSI